MVNVTVIIGTVSPKMTKVLYEFDEASKPTIADIKAAIKTQMPGLLLPCTAHYKCQTGSIATVEDNELYDPADNVWFSVKDTAEENMVSPSTSNRNRGKRKRMESKNDDEEEPVEKEENTEYSFQHNTTTLVLQQKNNLASWSCANAATMKIIYGMAKPRKDLMLNDKIDLYDYFNTARLRPVIVIIKFRKASPSLTVFEEAVVTLKRSMVKLAYSAFEGNEYSKHAVATTDMVHEWLKYSTILEWGNNGSRGAISHSLRSKAYTERLSAGNSNKAKKSKYGKKEIETNTEVFQALVSGINAIENIESIQAMYQTFPHFRRTWIDIEWKTANAYMEVINGFLENFPFLRDNIHFIEHDYGYLMEKKYGKIPDYTAALQKYATSFIALAEEQAIEIMEDDDENMVALHSFAELINFYCKTKTCNIQRFILTHKDMAPIETIMTRKNEITEKPVVIYDTERSIFHIAFVDTSVETKADTVMAAISLLLQIYCVFNIKFDLEALYIIEFMEVLESVRTSSNSGMINMKSSLEYIYRGIEDRKKPTEERNSQATQ